MGRVTRCEGAPGTRPAVRPCTACAGDGSQTPAAAAPTAPTSAVRLDMLKEAAAQPSSFARPADSAVLFLACRQLRAGASRPEADDWTRTNLRGGSGVAAAKPLRCADRKGLRCGSVPCLASQACPSGATVSAMTCMRLRL